MGREGRERNTRPVGFVLLPGSITPFWRNSEDGPYAITKGGIMAVRTAGVFVYFSIAAFLFGGTADSTQFPEIRLNDRVLILLHSPWQETMTVIDAGPSLILVDTWGSLASAKRAKVRIDSLFHKSVRFVINTHHHWDHTFGNAAFEGAATQIVGHRFCAEDMRADYKDAEIRKQYFENNASRTEFEPLRSYIRSVGTESSDAAFPIAPPTRTTGERDTLREGDLTFILYPTPGIHTRSNLTIYVPELGIVFGRWEFANPSNVKLEPGADPRLIAKVLDDVLAAGKPIHYLISGHGNPIENPDLKTGMEGLKGMNKK